MDTKRKTAYLCAIGTAIIWGAAFPVVKPALSYISSQQFLLLRHLIAATVLLPILIHAVVKKTFPIKKLKTIILFETLSMVTLSIVYLGLEKTSAMQASFILNTKPILITIAGILFLKETETRKELTGLILSVIGTAIVIATPFFFSSASNLPTFSENSGYVLLLLAMCIEVTYIIQIKKHYQGIDKIQLVATSAVIGALLFSCLNIANHTLPTWEMINHPEVILATLYMGVLGTAVAVALILKAYSLIEASEVALFEYLNPLIYIPLSIFWLGDTLMPLQAIGIALIMAGVFIAEVRKRSKSKRAKMEMGKLAQA